MAPVLLNTLSRRMRRRLGREARKLLHKAAELCDPGGDLGALDHIERRVFTPRALGAPLSGLRYLFIGGCQVGYLGEGAPHGCEVELILSDSSPGFRLPPLEPKRYDAAVIALTLRTLLNVGYGASADLAHARADWDAAAAGAAFERCVDLIDQQLQAMREALDGLPSFVFTFLEPSFDYLGVLHPAMGIEHPLAFVRRLNQALATKVAAYPNLHLFDLNEAYNAIGRLHLHDDVVNQFTHAAVIGTYDDVLDGDRRLVEVESNHRLYDVATALPVLQRYIFRQLGDAVKVLRGVDRVKLIIVDLDDTLWRGVAADSEMEGWARIEGWPLGFAEALLYFKRRGGLLAVCSKNDPASTAERFAAIWGDRLTLEDFAAVEIGWSPKPEGVAHILEAVNVLPEQALFIDDNPRELAEVAARFPTLRRLGGNPRDWRRIILRSPETQVEAISAESRRRTELVRGRTARDLAPQPADRAAWLASLELEQRVFLVADSRSAEFARALELLNKTNQFNTTGQRWSRAELESFLKRGGRVLAASLKDRLVDNGLIGVALLRAGEIVQVVLSCRVFGLGAEAALGAAATALALEGASGVTASLADTGRNRSCEGFFADLGFAETAKGWCATKPPPPPAWIRLKLDGALERDSFRWNHIRS